MNEFLRPVALGLTCLWVSAAAVHAQNVTVTYQGRVTANGAPFSGAGQFKFALVTSSNSSAPATATATVSFGFVVNITINAGGNGYVTPPAVTISGGGGLGATATASVNGGMVTGITINNNGSGYSGTPTVTIAAPPSAITYLTYWSNDGTSVAGSQPIATVGANVTGGLFSVQLGDTSLPNMSALSAALFTQANLQLRIWFNDGVNGFAALSPVQNLSAAPSAAFAHSAGTVTNGAITSIQLAPNSVGIGNIQNNSIAANKIASGQVVRSLNSLTEAVALVAGTNITLGVTGNTITIAGQAGGFPWLFASTPHQQTEPNFGYIVTNSESTSLTLPVAPFVGSIVRVVGTGSGGWRILQNAGQSILSGVVAPAVITAGESWTPRGFNTNWVQVASSADGTKLVAAVTNGQIYTSSDSGQTWTARESTRFWVSVASSADGTRLYAALRSTGGDRVYRSFDSGVNWSGFSPPPGSSSKFVACSAEWNLESGIKLVGAFYGGGATEGELWNCINPELGGNWTQLFDLPQSSWTAAAASADGTKWVAVPSAGQLATSTDSGTTWVLRDVARTWSAAASSADGIRLYATVAGGQIYASTNSGISWAVLPGSSGGSWASIACSADGSQLIAAKRQGTLYTSADFGGSWSSRESSRNWESVACSADGTKLVAAVRGGQIYTSQAVVSSGSQTTPGIYGSLSGGRGAAIELLYVGGGKFVPLSFVPSLSVY